MVGDTPGQLARVARGDAATVRQVCLPRTTVVAAMDVDDSLATVRVYHALDVQLPATATLEEIHRNGRLDVPRDVVATVGLDLGLDLGLLRSQAALFGRLVVLDVGGGLVGLVAPLLGLFAGGEGLVRAVAVLATRQRPGSGVVGQRPAAVAVAESLGALLVRPGGVLVAPLLLGLVRHAVQFGVGGGPLLRRGALRAKLVGVGPVLVGGAPVRHDLLAQRPRLAVALVGLFEVHRPAVERVQLGPCGVRRDVPLLGRAQVLMRRGRRLDLGLDLGTADRLAGAAVEAVAEVADRLTVAGAAGGVLERVLFAGVEPDPDGALAVAADSAVAVVRVKHPAADTGRTHEDPAVDVALRADLLQVDRGDPVQLGERVLAGGHIGGLGEPLEVLDLLVDVGLKLEHVRSLP